MRSTSEAQPLEDPEVGEQAPVGMSPGFRVLVVIFAAIGPFSLNIFKPCLPFIKADFGAPITVVQLGLSLSILAAAFATTLSGPLIDRVGRRPVIVGTAWLYMLSSVVGTLAPNVEWVILARIVQASTSSVAMIVVRAAIHDVEENAQKMIARATLGAVAAVLLAPALGGVLIEQIGWRAVFGLTALVGIAALIPVHRSVQETLPPVARAERGGPWWGGVVRLLRERVVLGYCGQSALHFAIFFSFTSAATYLMVDVLGREAYEYGLWFTFMAVFVAAGLGLAERVSARWRAGRVALAGSSVVMLGSLVSAWLLLSDSVTLTPLVLFLPATNAGVMDIVPEFAGTASSLLGFVQFVTAAVFAQIVVMDEPRTAEILADQLIVAGVGCVLLALLSAGHVSSKRDVEPS